MIPVTLCNKYPNICPIRKPVFFGEHGLAFLYAVVLHLDSEVVPFLHLVAAEYHHYLHSIHPPYFRFPVFYDLISPLCTLFPSAPLSAAF